MVKFLKLLILIPISVVVLAFAVANRQMISVSLDPFSNPDSANALVTTPVPLSMLLFLTLLVGVVLGGVATWFTQGKNRRKVRVAREEAEQWREEAMRARTQPPLIGQPTSGGRSLARLDV